MVRNMDKVYQETDLDFLTLKIILYYYQTH